MPSVPHIVRIRRRRWKKDRHTPRLRSAVGVLSLLSLSLIGALIALTLLYAHVTQDLPSPENLRLLLEPPDGFLLQPTRFYDRTGVELIREVENPAVSQRITLPLESEALDAETDEFLPVEIISATIAISDPTFWDNPGFSFRGVSENSHDTLAQKLVTGLLLWDEYPDKRRAIRERILAAQITHNYGREQVMAWFLNSADYGNLAYGVEAASQFYFGKSASQLNLAEAAVLAAVAESPALNPLDSPQSAIERGKVVLEAMAGQGLITKEQSEQAQEVRIFFQTFDKAEDEIISAFLNLVWEYLSTQIPVEVLERGGFRIITTLDYKLQNQVSCTIDANIARFRSQVGADLEVDHIDDQVEDCPTAKLLPTLTLEDEAFLSEISTEVVVLDPLSGQVLAMGYDSPSNRDVGLQNGHPPGSLMTPFVALTAFTRGFSPASLVWDIPLDMDAIPDLKLNPQGQYQGPVRLRTALANDYLTPAVQMINKVGIENVLQTSRQLGLDPLTNGAVSPGPPDCPGCALILDDGDVSLVEAVQAYGVFSNWGILVGISQNGSETDGLAPLAPVTVLHVQDFSQRKWFEEREVQNRPVISRQLAYLVLDILKDEDARWPSLGHPNPLEIGRPAGAKIGTTSTGNDVWTVGFTPNSVVGVWMGVPDEDKALAVPPKLASALWHALIQQVSQGDPPGSWETPVGITSVDVCSPSGMLPTVQCPTVVSELFLTGQEPTQPDSLFQAYQVNRETGRLATVLTPPDLIETRTYLTAPPEASTWADRVGLERPPETYDEIYQPTVIADVQIHAPQMFESLSGSVTIEGQAGGEGFITYRLQAGQGLNPSGWIVIQEDTPRPVQNGILGTWDTNGINGLYALQLIVLRDQQRVDTTTIQVTVDNVPPDIGIPYPEDGAVYPLSDRDRMTLLVQVEDNLGLEAVVFYLDDRLVGTQTQLPYAHLWEMVAGRHVFTAKAIDRAGNTAEDSVTFIVE